jgi:predicted DNA-binding transcriptional regulator AlpA
MRMMRARDTYVLLGMSRATFYRMLKRDSTFPAATRYHERGVRYWRDDEVLKWRDSKRI